MLSPIKSLAMIAAFAAAAPAFAETATRSVNTGDLNLATVDGREVLDRRIERAARQVCDHVPTQDLAKFAASSRCYKAAIAAARQDAEIQIAARSGGNVLIGSR
jgi:UrcA family protein